MEAISTPYIAQWRPLWVFFISAYIISWIIWLPLYAPAWGLPILPFHHALGGLGPMFAAFFTAGIYRGKAEVRRLLRACFQFKPLLYLSTALFSPFILAFIAAVVSKLINDTPINLFRLTHFQEFPQFSLWTFFIYNLVFFGFGEEVGWRGFALPRLQRRMHIFTATAVLTILWAIWHWPLFLYRPGYTEMNTAGIIGWVFSLLTGSILLTWLYNKSKGSILICAVFHATIDIAFTADWQNENMVTYLGMLITIWGLATIPLLRAVKEKPLGDQEALNTI